MDYKVKAFIPSLEWDALEKTLQKKQEPKERWGRFPIATAKFENGYFINLTCSHPYSVGKGKAVDIYVTLFDEHASKFQTYITNSIHRLNNVSFKRENGDTYTVSFERQEYVY